MPKIKHIATGPNGETFKRESVSRTYSHCVIGRRSYETALRRIMDERRYHASNFDYYSSCANGTHKFPSFYREEGMAKAKAEGEAWIAENGNDRDTYVARMHQADMDALAESKAKGDFDRFFQIGWAGREDLAQKAASQALTGGYYAETRYIPATVIQAGR